MSHTPEPSDAAQDRWLQSALEEYKSLRDESLKGLQAQQVGVQIGVTLLVALIGVGIKINNHLTGAILLDGTVPLLTIFLTILWQGELERSVRAGRYLAVRETTISEVTTLPHVAPSMGWEAWLSRNPQFRLLRYYNAEFAVVGLLALASAVLGVIGLVADRRWGMAVAASVASVALLGQGLRYYVSNYHRLVQIGADVRVGVVAFSFGSRRPGSGASPVNRQLADIAGSICASWNTPTVVAAQYEVAEHLHVSGATVVTVTPEAGTSYFDSEHVWQQARESFRSVGVSSIIAVAHPFLHLRYVRRLIRHDGFSAIPVHIPRIGFDRSLENQQWWTRGRLALICYGVLHFIGISWNKSRPGRNDSSAHLE